MSPRKGSPLLGGLTPEGFLRRHWQNRPLFVKGAWPDFRDPLTPEVLAGLACEEQVSARLVQEHVAPRGRAAKVPWTVEYGPFDEARFEALPSTHWTVLVAGVNRWLPRAADLLEPFAFVPNHRVDDVMVSYAAPQGTVGPHVDSYDVFLLQGRGRRRWSIAEKPRSLRWVSDVGLRVLADYAPEKEWITEPGDLLYLPPGVAHHGVALEPCLTYSIGFRAPSAGELWLDLAHHQAGSGGPADKLLEDPDLRPGENPGEIDLKSRRHVRALVRSLDGSDEAIDRWFGTFASKLRPGSALTPPRRSLGEAEILRRLRSGQGLRRSEDCRFVFYTRPRGAVLFYYDGRELSLGGTAAKLARAIAARRTLDAATVTPLLGASDARALLAELLDAGALSFNHGRR